MKGIDTIPKTVTKTFSVRPITESYTVTQQLSHKVLPAVVQLHI